jgi:hypothetical protein
MVLLQKINRPTVRILGTEYSSRIVGLHNRLRAHARRLHVYKDVARLGASTAPLPRGAFVPRRKRLVIYLRRGAPELTVAHELMHAILFTEGFLPSRCRTDDVTRTPQIAELALRLNDLLVHPVLLDRLERSGYGRAPDVDRHAERRLSGGHNLNGGPASRPSVSAPPEGRILALLARSVAAAEWTQRSAGRESDGIEDALERRSAGLGSLSRRIAREAPWKPKRAPLDARVRAARILRLLDTAATDLWGDRLHLQERILLPAYLTRRRLASPASRVFDVRRAEASPDVVLIQFLPDGTACSARRFSSVEKARGAEKAVRSEIDRVSASRFAARHRLECLIVDKGRKVLVAADLGGRAGEPMPDGGA